MCICGRLEILSRIFLIVSDISDEKYQYVAKVLFEVLKQFPNAFVLSDSSEAPLCYTSSEFNSCWWDNNAYQ